jgi:hypothetical protein
VSKPPSQNLHLIVIVANLGVPKPLFQAETLLVGFTKLPPKPLALPAGFGQHLWRFQFQSSPAALAAAATY